MSKRSGTTLLPFLFLCVLLSWTRGWALEDENSDEKEHRFALPQEAFNAKHRRESSESGGTKVKWTAGDNSGKHASAPRSQRYWDEHGLGGENRPDYAKTDAEVLAERWGNKAGFTRLARTFFFLVVGAFFLLNGGKTIFSAFSSWPTIGERGEKVGGGVPGSSTPSVEQQRQARLARFGSPNSSPTSLNSSSQSSSPPSSSTTPKKPSSAYKRAMAQAMGRSVD
jgi:hypothetical protein